jgi:GNAT superfamily N-acetyltransferase
MGWVVQRNAEVYAAEFGWDQTYEALVARIVADYVDSKDAKREAAWIAEVGGARAGCVFCVRENDTTARLRLLLVDPWARGLGIGGRLVDEVLRFARAAGYTSITLWTNDILASARRIYQRAGFTLDNESPHHSFGHDLTGQNWSRSLVLPVPQTAAYACWRPHADPAWTYRRKTGSVVETARMLSRLSGLRAWRSGIPDRHARTNAGTSGAGPGGPSGHSSHTTRTGGTGGSLRYRRRGSRRRSGKPG